MDFNTKKQLCANFFNNLAAELDSTYELMESCNNDFSKYLCKSGTTEEVTYESKPVKSFRISDHWNWFANINKCPDEHYIQCYSTDMPRTKFRNGPGKPSSPVLGISVMIFGEDGKYHVVYGEKFDRKKKKWEWVENDISTVLQMI